MPIPAVSGLTYVPQDFAESGQDDNTTLEKFFAFAASSESRGSLVAALGSWHLNRRLEIRGVKRTSLCDITLWDDVGLNDVVLIKDNQASNWIGDFRIRGKRWDTARIYVGGDTVNGVRLESNRLATLPDFDVRGCSGWGVYHAHSDKNNSNMMKIGRTTFLNCGTNARRDREYFVDAESFSNYESNNHAQRTYIQLSADSSLPSEAHHLTRAFVYTTDIDGKNKAHLVTDVDHDAKRLTVYPRIPDQYQFAGKLGLCFGGGMCLNVSGDTAKAQFGLVTATRCGPALWLSEQYTPTGVGVVSQYCATPMVLGDQPQNGYGGTALDVYYAEGEPLGDMIITCQAENAPDTNASMLLSTMGFEIDRVQSLGWLRPNGQNGKRDRYIPLIFPQNNKLFLPPHNRDLIRNASDDEGSYSVFSSPTPNGNTYARIIRKSSRLMLVDNQETRSIRGVEPGSFDLYGDGENGEYRKNFVVDCQTGYTINHKEGPIELPRYTVPITIHYLLDVENNWNVTITKHEVI